MSDKNRAAFWDKVCEARGHTGYGDPLLHRYDQRIRLASVNHLLRAVYNQDMRGRAALDVGCGTGDFIALLRGNGAEVMGMDISASVIKKTARRFEADRHVSLSAGSILDLRLQPNSFDTITSITVLQHIIDPVEFSQSLLVLRSALRPEGQMIVLELAPPHSGPVKINDANGYTYIVERPPSEWERAFTEAGFRIVQTPVFPQLGIALLRELGASINRMRGNSLPSVNRKSSEGPAELSAMSSLRQVKRKSLALLRRSLLFCAFPFDHWLRLPLPPAKYRHYRLWVIARQS